MYWFLLGLDVLLINDCVLHSKFGTPLAWTLEKDMVALEPVQQGLIGLISGLNGLFREKKSDNVDLNIAEFGRVRGILIEAFKNLRVSDRLVVEKLSCGLKNFERWEKIPGRDGPFNMWESFGGN